MKRSIYYTLSLVFLTFICVACKKCKTDEVPPQTLKGTWKPGTVLLNNTGQNLASTGFQYANFSLMLDGTTDESGTYTVSGMPLPYPATFSGTWTKASSTITFVTGAPAGITNITNVAVAGTQITFVMTQNTAKTGTLALYFTLNKQ